METPSTPVPTVTDTGSWDDWGSCLCRDPLEADADIAGIGVVLAFLISAGLAVLCTCFYLILIRSGQIPDESPQLHPYLAWKYLDDINPLDAFMRSKICKPVARYLLSNRWFAARHERIRNATYALVVSLADTQLATGIAMLMAAIIKLNRGTISVYHFLMVTNMAWFSTNVHLTALLAIRTKVIGSVKKQRRWDPAAASGLDIVIKVLSMLVLAALLLYCSYICGAAELYDYYHCPANCAVGQPQGGVPLAWTIVNFSFIIFAYLQRAFMMWPSLSQWFLTNIRPWILDSRAQKDRDRTPLWRYAVTIPFYFCNSETMEVLLDGYIWFALGVYWTFGDRQYAHELWRDKSDIVDENDIDGFGQLVPVLLLGVPLMSALDTYCGEGREAAREEQRKDGSSALTST